MLLSLSIEGSLELPLDIIPWLDLLPLFKIPELRLSNKLAFWSLCLKGVANLVFV